MPSVPADPRFGALISEHRRSYTYPVLVGFGALLLIAGGIYVAVQGDFGGGFLVAGIAAAVAIPYIFAQSRRRLFLHEHGLRLVRGGKVQSILWRDIVKTNTTFSYHPHPDTIIDITFKQALGPRLVLRMNWSGRKELARQLWPLIQTQPQEKA